MNPKSKILIALSAFFPLIISVHFCYGASATYTYDNLNRLTRVTYENGITEEYTYDASGNRLRFIVNQSTSDAMAPALSITSHSNNRQVNTPGITLSGTASDGSRGDSGISRVTVNGVKADNDIATGSGTANWSKALALNLGANTITVVAYDNSLNRNQATQTITIYYGIPDTTESTVTISSPTTETSYITKTSPITIGGTATDDEGVTGVIWVNDRGGNGNCTGTTSWTTGGIALYDGQNMITVIAQDQAGNKGKATLKVIYDITVPTSSISDPKNGMLFMGTAYPIKGTADDGLGTGLNKVEVSTDGGATWKSAMGTASWSYDWIISGAGKYTILSRATDEAGNVEVPGPGVQVTVAKRQPTAVNVDGRRLLVNGSPFTIKGVGYSPVPIGEDPEVGPPYGDYFTPNYSGIYNRDLPKLREMGANAVRIWNWGNAADHLDFLDQAFNTGNRPVYVIPGFTINPGLNIDPDSPGNVRETLKSEFRNMVATHKNHPAILMWSIGNNLNHFYAGNQGHLYSLINELALAAHEEEGTAYHPVVVSLADENLTASIGTHEAQVPGLDIWGVNAYRGKTFGSLFTDYPGVSAKPLLITEYGIDAFDQVHGNEYEVLGVPYQAEYAQSLWNQINANGSVCIGGILREYSDEWWLGKYSTGSGCPELSPSIHSRCGYANANQPDGYTNEEWWGLMRSLDNGTSTDLMAPRASFYTMKSLWTGSTAFKLTGGAYIFPETPTYKATFSLDVTASAAPTGSVKYYYARTRMNFVSIGISSAYLSGSKANVTGTGTVNGTGTYTFTATVVNGNPDTFGIEIRKTDSSLYYSAPAKAISGGDLAIQMQ